MKYIVVGATLNNFPVQIPIIFPNNLIHLDMFESISHQLRIVHDMENCIPVAAGEVSLFDGVSCSGRSETLKVKSRGEEDEKLIRNIDYTGVML